MRVRLAPVLVGLLAAAALAVSTTKARAEYPVHDRPLTTWSVGSARERELGMAVLTTRSVHSMSDAPGMMGGKVLLHMRVSPRWAFEWGASGFGGSAGGGFLAGGFAMSAAPNALLYLTPRSRLQLYATVGYEFGVHYLRGGGDIPKEARPGFVYSGPNGGAGLDVRIDEHWALRFEGRAFALIRGFPDERLKDNPRLQDGTRWLTGITLATGLYRSFGGL